jgi:hypothetical protein
MIDLSTKYLGMQLRTPLVASASPISHEISHIRGLEDAGASAVVLYSLFEEQLHKEALELELHLNAGTESFAEALTYFPHSSEFHTGPEAYSESHPQSQGRGRHSHYRQPQRRDSGRLDQVCQASREGRSRRHRVQSLFHSDQHGNPQAPTIENDLRSTFSAK